MPIKNIQAANFGSYFKPLDEQHHGWKNLKGDKLPLLHKIAAVAVTVLLTLGVITIPFAIPVFRLLTKSTEKLLDLSSRVNDVALENLIQHFKSDKGSNLNRNERQKINKLRETMEKIDKQTPIISSDQTIAPFKVRNIVQLRIGEKDYKIELGTKDKIFVPAKKTSSITSGGYGIIFLAGKLLKSGMEIIEKMAKADDPKTEESFKREKEFTEKLHTAAGGHQKGIQLAPYRIYVRENGNIGYYVPKYLSDAEGYSLAKKLRDDPSSFGLDDPSAILKGVQDLLTGLAACHKEGIAHRDIKPDNICIQMTGPDGGHEWALADFGLATDISDAGENNVAGSIGYLSFHDRKLQSKATDESERMELQKKQDLYGLGTSLMDIIYAVINPNDYQSEVFLNETDKYYAVNQHGGHPGDEKKIKELLDKVEQKFGLEFRNILYDMIHPDPNERPTADELLERWTMAMQ